MHSGVSYRFDHADVGRLKGSDVIKTYKRPESVLVLVCTHQREVLLMERSDIPGFWQSVTGSLEGTETPQQAATRELHEETGLVITPTNLMHQETFAISAAWRARYAPDVTHNVEHWFRVLLPNTVAVTLHPNEHSKAIWLPIQEALEMCSSPSNCAAIKRFANE